MSYYHTLKKLVEQADIRLSTIKPSEWAEQNLVMGKPFPGPFRYDRTPYTREIIDCFSPDHPARTIAVMKGAQVGYSAGVLYPVVGWIIAQQPGNVLFSVGHESLIEPTMQKLDLMIDGAGIRDLIKPAVKRNKAGKTGDTNTVKEFNGGYVVVISVNNHKAIRQRDMQYGLIDDYEAVKQSSKESGDTKLMIEQRFAAYNDQMKLAYISTPELKHTSNIEPAYLLGDQRRYKIHCECCHKPIHLEWSLKVGELDAGITWRVDESGELIESSIGYICQLCGGFFTDKGKYSMLLNGFWEPTSKPSRPGYYSYHLSSLYAPIGMYDWKHYVRNYIDAEKLDGHKRHVKMQAHYNLCLGLTYEKRTEDIKASVLQMNAIDYEIGIVPSKVSVDHGNGKIILLTMACDLNGVVDDARLDYEVVGWSESGSSYSIVHGSIGTFIPKEGSLKNKSDREKWTYEHNKANNVWSELMTIIKKKWIVDDGREMEIYITGIDCGHYSMYAYPFIELNTNKICGLKGKDQDKYIKYGVDVPVFKMAKEKNYLYLLEVGCLKDDLVDLISLKYDKKTDPQQPPGFMNFPLGSKKLYQYNNYYSHYEAEERVIVEETEGKPAQFIWKKKTSASQNHFFDVRIYNIAVKEIATSVVCRFYKIKNYTWADFVNIVKQISEKSQKPRETEE